MAAAPATAGPAGPAVRPLSWLRPVLALARRLAWSRRDLATRRRLAALPDYLLRDVGLTRADLLTIDLEGEPD